MARRPTKAGSKRPAAAITERRSFRRNGSESSSATAARIDVARMLIDRLSVCGMAALSDIAAEMKVAAFVNCELDPGWEAKSTRFTDLCDAIYEVQDILPDYGRLGVRHAGLAEKSWHDIVANLASKVLFNIRYSDALIRCVPSGIVVLGPHVPDLQLIEEQLAFECDEAMKRQNKPAPPRSAVRSPAIGSEKFAPQIAVLVAVYQMFPEQPLADPLTAEAVFMEIQSLLGAAAAICEGESNPEVFRSLFLHCKRARRTFAQHERNLPEYPDSVAEGDFAGKTWHSLTLKVGFRFLADLRLLSRPHSEESTCDLEQEWALARTFSDEVASRGPGPLAPIIARWEGFRFGILFQRLTHERSRYKPSDDALTLKEKNEQRDKILREIYVKQKLKNEWADLAGLANDDPRILELKLPRKVSRDIARVAINGPRNGGKNRL